MYHLLKYILSSPFNQLPARPVPNRGFQVAIHQMHIKAEKQMHYLLQRSYFARDISSLKRSKIEDRLGTS
jgi:hypothetical protein